VAACAIGGADCVACFEGKWGIRDRVERRKQKRKERRRERISGEKRGREERTVPLVLQALQEPRGSMLLPQFQ
jgi:hypothetical protein